MAPFSCEICLVCRGLVECCGDRRLWSDVVLFGLCRSETVVVVVVVLKEDTTTRTLPGEFSFFYTCSRNISTRSTLVFKSLKILSLACVQFRAVDTRYYGASYLYMRWFLPPFADWLPPHPASSTNCLQMSS